MKKLTLHLRALMSIAGALSLSACLTLPQAPSLPAAPTIPRIGSLLDKASQASNSGNKEEAIALWKQTSTAYPADKTPWTNIAQTRYEAGQYGEAILSAQEVLVRDPNDKQANSIIAISGLRLSTRALADLSRQNNLTGTLRTESQDLAKLLRESLGETVPVPTTVIHVTKSTIKRPSSPPSPKASSVDDNNANPFDIFKKTQ